MKTIYRFICFVFFSAWVFNVQAQQDTLRILAIGNSFSQDAVEQYLYDLAKATNKPIIIGNLYIGGAPLSLHWENASEDKPAYSYRKIGVDGKKVIRKGTALSVALVDEPWDFVTLQQASPLSGKFDSYKQPVTDLLGYLGNMLKGNAHVLWHQTWAYAPTSTHKGFLNYNKDQKTMYKGIMHASRKVKTLGDKALRIDGVIPSGAAIQNARTVLGDDLTRDGYHLDLGIGRFIAACTWYEFLFKQEAPVDKYHPDAVDSFDAVIAQQAAHAANLKPFSLTKLKVGVLK